MVDDEFREDIRRIIEENREILDALAEDHSEEELDSVRRWVIAHLELTAEGHRERAEDLRNLTEELKPIGDDQLDAAHEWTLDWLNRRNRQE